MSLSARLQLGDNSLELYNSEYSVVECKYKLSKSYRRDHRNSDTKSSVAKIVLTVVAPMSGDFQLYSWYADMLAMNGRVVIELSSILAAYSENSCKTICFEDAICIGIAENYDIENLSRRELTMTLLAKRLVVDTVEINVCTPR